MSRKVFSILFKECTNSSRLGRWVKLHRLFPAPPIITWFLLLHAYICILYPYRPTDPSVESIVTGVPVRWMQSSNHRPFFITRVDCSLFASSRQSASLLSGA
ncbi:uncharacterized protein BDW47DRAFT_97512 [Aspergillus candidus]|uniref:Uncharacterized protein n=1 Tax=Aspergillus candidus TaxID=41067 RepID=A0A2I2FPS9_ASPCN|nr:hypothetical protein BDW47DRAFT_97512 [Aspergillus candidus]PLB42624.1 hypothetical protein BDW47DRAFT_97512 [Aspergillus candidus]